MTVFGTSYFPSIAYLNELCRADKSILDYGEHYPKQTFRNRCSILNSNGKLDLSIPVIRPNGNKSLTGIVEVSSEKNWRRDHWRSISAGYASSPYFEHYESEVKHLIFQNSKLLVDFNSNCLKFINQSLHLNLKHSSNDIYIEQFEEDFRSFDFEYSPEPYQQVIFGQNEFVPNLSILDALFCLGPMARTLILTS